MKSVLHLFFLLFSCEIIAQFAPPAGEPGSTAIHADSSIFVAWATQCTLSRGFQQINNPSLGYASGGDELTALNQAGANGTVSLGDGGHAIVQFEYPIKNGEGFDFAVFENSFDGFFLELAFVEVSSDGINFFRFPSISLTDTMEQKGTFDLLEAQQLHNLAGKYRLFYGTPFDLDELADEVGLDVNAVTHIKIIDVVGIVNSEFTQRDALGNPINDPWPTPFFSSGFDLDAVGVIHSANPQLVNEKDPFHIKFYPNPVKGDLFVLSKEPIQSLMVYSTVGEKLLNLTPNLMEFSISLQELKSGIYHICFTQKGKMTTHKFVKL
jgi:hypothetical protein